MTVATLAFPPSAVAVGPSPNVSPRYQFISTMDVVKHMENEGFILDSIVSKRGRGVSAKTAFGTHQAVFVHKDAPRVLDQAQPRVLFTNSHDGSTTARFRMGLYRFVCSNGLVIGSDYARETVRHAGEAAATLIERVRRLAQNTAPIFRQIDTWTKRELSASEVREFGELAAVLRFGDLQRFNPEQLLEVRRADDDGRTLWNVFNRVQENAMSGGLEGVSANGRRLTSRPLRGIDESMDFNVQLWKLAEEFV